MNSRAIMWLIAWRIVNRHATSWRKSCDWSPAVGSGQFSLSMSNLSLALWRCRYFSSRWIRSFSFRAMYRRMTTGYITNLRLCNQSSSVINQTTSREIVPGISRPIAPCETDGTTLLPTKLLLRLPKNFRTSREMFYHLIYDSRFQDRSPIATWS